MIKPFFATSTKHLRNNEETKKEKFLNSLDV